jgi:uncharacterized membrane protein YhhN
MWSLRKKLLVWTCGVLAAVIVLGMIAIAVLWRHLNGGITMQTPSSSPRR